MIKIGDQQIGSNHPTFIIAEIGINHNGSIDNAKELIREAAKAGCDAVKFQKRTVNLVYTEEELAASRVSIYGLTNGDLKYGLEFSDKEYGVIDKYCRDLGILWFASCWDEQSVEFISKYSPPCFKIASASLTDDNLLKCHREINKPIFLSTGMSTISEIDHAVEVLGKSNLIIMHCTSTYPAPLEELNLSTIKSLRDRYKTLIGYSGHEVGLATSVAAVAMGACAVERHITLDRSIWGSDQPSSVEPIGLQRMVKDIRGLEKAVGDGIKKVYPSEIPIKNKLRRIG